MKKETNNSFKKKYGFFNISNKGKMQSGCLIGTFGIMLKI